MQSNLVFITDVTPSTLTWTVKVRVEEKMQPRQSTTSPTKYQKIILADEKGSKVVATLYQRDINTLANTLLVHNTYIISRARVDPIEEKYRIIDNPYQWIINSKTAILRVDDGFAASSENVSLFTRLSELPSLVGSKSLIDVLIVVIDKMPRRTIVSRGRTIPVQDLGVIDSDLKPYALTLWSNFAEDFGAKLKVDSRNMPVVKFTRFIVNTYYGISLGSTASSGAIINPPIPEATKLTAWKRKNVDVLREIAVTRSYLSRSGASASANSVKLMDISSLLDSTEMGKTRVEAYAKITDVGQRCFYVACDKCPSSTTAEVGWEFECSRCQELRVAVPRAKVSIMLYDKDADVDAFAFGEIAEKLLRRSAADCMNDHRMGLNGFMHFANEHLNEKACVFTVRKKHVLRKDGEEDQYIITDIIDENEDMTTTHTPDLVPGKDDKGKAVSLTQLSPLHDSLEGAAHAGNLISVEGKLSSGPAATQSRDLNLVSSSTTAKKLFDSDKLVYKDEVPPCFSSTTTCAPTEEPIPCDSDVDISPLVEKGPRKLLLPAGSDDEHVPIIRSSKRKRT